MGGGVGRDEVKRRSGEAREDRGDRLPGVLARGDRDDFDTRVAQQNAQQTEPDSGETFIPLDGGNPAGGTNTQPAAGGQTPGHDSGNKQPAGAQAGSNATGNAGQPSGTQTTQDDFIIEFNDDYEKRTSNTNSGNAQQDDDRQDSYGLEDEYYDLDGF